MKIKLVENHSFKQCYVDIMNFLDKELSADEILQILAGEFGPFVLTDIENGIVYVDHPHGW